MICLHVFDQQSLALRRPRARPLGGAARWWLAQSLRSLAASLNALGAPLVLRDGPAADVMVTLAREVDAASVCWNEIAMAPHQAVADGVAAALAEIGVASRSFPGDLLVNPPISATRKAVACGCSRHSGSVCKASATRQNRLPPPKP